MGSQKYFMPYSNVNSDYDLIISQLPQTSITRIGYKSKFKDPLSICILVSISQP